ncbi:hypothetical protein BCV72DRAFT_237466 [Rhizopus microsporus var. microsporus]|uniref:Uncharacterized protein n=2 Tax=Rhizopus microsporus TaxID=58291 RepID=A0A2G4SS61_RHIZD|nr:uncharacterized protein RHIMIDRAFT_257114 [Rhizopus microsporus ATCC 52813]ORE00696.1 hypothetical protein BCV72DRAFT_237466 [Rhizopus microsporus var. microsporus]PHZ11226.1 hypothetical protein RHIMIDRAFT_257114 [Rhizopus microsporus ATCC 52813]
MSAANEYCFGVTTYLSPEAIRNIINLLCHYLPSSIKLYYKKGKSIKKQNKTKVNQVGRCFSMLDHPEMLLLLWLCLYS